MPILLPKSVFIHIPKTGGTWVTAVLKRTGLFQVGASIHRPPHEFKHLIGERKYFTFVRNPVTWYQSRWSGAYARDHHPVKLVNQPGFQLADDYELKDFKVWVANVVERTSLTSLYKSYLGESLDDCDYIGKTEHLQQDLQTALTQMGEKFNPKFLKTTNKRNESAVLDRWYSRPLLKKVIESNKEVMDKFGYPTNWRAYSNLIA